MVSCEHIKLVVGEHIILPESSSVLSTLSSAIFLKHLDYLLGGLHMTEFLLKVVYLPDQMLPLSHQVLICLLHAVLAGLEILDEALRLFEVCLKSLELIPFFLFGFYDQVHLFLHLLIHLVYLLVSLLQLLQ